MGTLFIAVLVVAAIPLVFHAVVELNAVEKKIRDFCEEIKKHYESV